MIGRPGPGDPGPGDDEEAVDGDPHAARHPGPDLAVGAVAGGGVEQVGPVLVGQGPGDGVAQHASSLRPH